MCDPTPFRPYRKGQGLLPEKKRQMNRFSGGEKNKIYHVRDLLPVSCLKKYGRKTITPTRTTRVDIGPYPAGIFNVLRFQIGDIRGRSDKSRKQIFRAAGESVPLRRRTTFREGPV